MEVLIDALERAARESQFSGVVSVFEGEREWYTGAFGYADVANARANNPLTRFGIASGTKFFTALGIGVLIDQGRLALDARVHDLFQQELPWVGSTATVAHLLNHTSGIYDYYDEEIIEDFDNFFVEIPWYRLHTPLDYLPLFAGRPAKFAPGERFSYSNGGYVCLGMILEKVTGQLYRDFIQQAVFGPAGMAASGFDAFNRLSANTALGYKENGDANFYNLPARGAADGGAYTTTYDLQKMWRALFAGQLLGPERLREFFSPQARIRSGVDYGYGVYLSRWGGAPVYSIVGGDAGVGFDSRYFPETRVLVNILSNRTNGEEDLRAVVREYFQAKQ